jgi:hypothetical protein
LVLGAFVTSTSGQTNTNRVGLASPQTNTNRLVPVSNRYLLLVETSHAMQLRGGGLLSSVQNLLSSGMSGQLHRGDTLGLWTFNSELHAGDFPLQHWSAEGQQSLMSLMLSFLQQQKFEKQARLDKVMPALNRLITDSPFITIVIVSEGTQPMHGTRFDHDINAIYQKWRVIQEKEHMPFITVLRANAGKLTDFAVSAAPWPVEMPPLPAELQQLPVVATATNPPIKSTPTVQTQRFLPNIILSGRKSDVTNASEQPSPKSDSLLVPLASSETATDQVLRAQSPVVETAPKTAPQAFEAPSRPSIDPAPVTAPDLPKAAASASPQPPSVKPAASAPTSDLTPAPSQTATITPAAASPALSHAPVPDSAPTVTAPNTQDNRNSPTNKSAPTAATSSPQTATAVPAESWVSRKVIWISGLAFLSAAGVCVLLLLRQPRSAGRASLITRSLERERKS